jgi:hypothetical protein
MTLHLLKGGFIIIAATQSFSIARAVTPCQLLRPHGAIFFPVFVFRYDIAIVLDRYGLLPNCWWARSSSCPLIDYRVWFTFVASLGSVAPVRSRAYSMASLQSTPHYYLFPLLNLHQ